MTSVLKSLLSGTAIVRAPTTEQGADGPQIEITAEELTAFKTMFEGKAQRPTTLSDESLIAVMVSADGQELDDTQWTQRILEAEKDSRKEEANKSVAITGNREQEKQAERIASELNADKDFNDIVRVGLDADEVKSVLPARILFKLEEHFTERDKQGKAIGCEIDAWPIAMSEVPTKDKPHPDVLPEKINGVWNPDKYTRRAKNDKGNWVNRPASFFGNIADSLEEGVFIKAASELLSMNRADRNASKSPIAKLYKDWGSAECKAEKDRLDKRRTRLIAAVRKARMLRRMFLLVKDKLPLVVAEYVTAPTGEGKTRAIKLVPKCIKVYDKAEPADPETYTIQSFLSLNVDKAVREGGTFNDVMNAVGERDQAEDSGSNVKFDLDTFREGIADYGKFLMDNTKEISRELNKRDHQEATDTLLLDMYDLFKELAYFCDDETGKFSKQVENALNRRSEKTKKDLEAAQKRADELKARQG